LDSWRMMSVFEAPWHCPVQTGCPEAETMESTDDAGEDRMPEMPNSSPL
jgi:hypothetical protein